MSQRPKANQANQATPEISASADRAGWSFGRLLGWHLDRGTSPQEVAGTLPRKRWKIVAFAGATGFNERTVRYWRRGGALPNDVETIERILFNNSSVHEQFRTELRDAYNRAAASNRSVAKPPETPPLPTPTITKPTHFLGRDSLRDAVAASLLAPTPPPTLILGEAGIGKTTLTHAVATHPDIASRFATRRFFVPLETAQNADTAATAIIRAIGLDPASSRIEHALAALAATPALLVLDNLETPAHAQPRETEALLAQLGAVEGLALLASLRGMAALRQPRWDTHRLKPLDDAAASVLFRGIAKGIAETDPHLAPFLEALGGLPLAIELVAHRAATHATLAELWAEWQRIGTELAQRDDLPEDAHDRLSSLHASLRLSMASRRMHLPARRLFALLGALPAGLADQDRAALLGTASLAARDVLLALGLATPRPGRLDLLPPIRDFARRISPPHPADATTWRDYFLALARDEGGKVGGQGGGAAVVRLTPEFANLEAAFAAAIATGDRAAALAARYGMAELIQFTGLGSSAQHGALADACLAVDDARGAGDSLFSLATIALARSDLKTASSRYEDVLSLYHKAGFRQGEANCIMHLGDIALRTYNYDTARGRYEEALPIYRGVDDVMGEANCIKSLGDIALRRSDYETAGDRYTEALPIYHGIGGVLGEANCIRNLGDISLLKSDHDAAGARYVEALALYRSVGAALGEANCIMRLGDLALERSDYDTASARYAEALLLYRSLGAMLGEADCIRGLGDVARAGNDTAAAAARYAEALTLYHRVPDPYSIGDTHWVLALMTSEAERGLHIEAARTAWVSIGRGDLVAQHLDPLTGAA